MQRRALPFEAPEGALFTLKDLTYSPEQPREKEPFTVKGKIELFGIPFVTPSWVQAKVTYPERWWEEIIPIIGGPTISEGATVFGGNFEIKFPRGFDREGEFILEVSVYLGPTYSFDSITLPPFPPVASEKTTFIVAGEVPEEELGFRNFRILSYAKNGGSPVTPPGVLELDVGDRLQIKLGFDHRDLAVTGKVHAAIWQKTWYDPHDEVLSSQEAFGVPASDDWKPYEESIEIIITSKIAPGTEYGLYAKIMGITGGDIFTDYLENVITIKGMPPEEADIKDFDFKLTKGTYNVGDKVSFIAPYDYKGIEQDGQLTISIGTGIYPTFNAVSTFPPKSIPFVAAADWEARGLEGNIMLPDILEAGQTYSVRAKLETLKVKTQETDTDWSAFDIRPEEEVYKGTISQKRLEYNETEGIIPIGDVAYGSRGLVHIWGRNDTSKNQTLGIGWLVTDPDGGEVERHENDWALGWVGANQDREFIGGRFDLDKAGIYHIDIALYMNSGDPVKIDTYSGVLCTVKEEAPGVAEPEIETLSARNITAEGATLRAELIEEGFCSEIMCYFEWGKTTGYGKLTPERRLYPGEQLIIDLSNLNRETTYHFRAVAVGRCRSPYLFGYGMDRSFTTEAELVKKFWMRVIRPPAGAVYWHCTCVSGDYPHMKYMAKMDEIWEWRRGDGDELPKSPVAYLITTAGEEVDGYWPHITRDWLDFQPKAGRHYVFDFETHLMTEESWP